METLRVQEIPPANTVEEAGVWLRLRSPTKVYELLESGQLRSVIVGGRRLITGASIVELLRVNEQVTYAPTRESPKRRERAAPLVMDAAITPAPTPPKEKPDTVSRYRLASESREPARKLLGESRS